MRLTNSSGIKVNPDGVLVEVGASKVCIRLFNGGERIYLHLNHVAVRILIVHASGGTMIDTPERGDATSSALLVGRDEVLQTRVPEGDVVQASCQHRILGGTTLRKVADGNAMVLVVIR